MTSDLFAAGPNNPALKSAPDPLSPDFPPPARLRRVAITGAAGSIGRQACRGLKQRGHFVRGLDIHPDPPTNVPMDDYVAADLSTPDAPDASHELVDAFRDVDTVIHLAAIIDDAPFLTDLLPHNIIATYRVLAAAQAAGVQRIMPASSVQVVYGYDRDAMQLTVDMPVAPPNHYAVTKMFLEALARMYAVRHNQAVLVVRPGWLAGTPRVLESIGASASSRRTNWSQDDAARFFILAVESDRPGPGEYEVVYGASLGDDMTIGLDREPAHRLLGYVPRDVWPHGNPDLR